MECCILHKQTLLGRGRPVILAYRQHRRGTCVLCRWARCSTLTSGKEPDRFAQNGTDTPRAKIPAERVNPRERFERRVEGN